MGTTVLIVYLLLMAWHGLTGSRATHSVTDFHVAGRRVPGAIIGLSFYATFMSTNSFLGLAGLSAAMGFSTWWIGLLFAVFGWLSWRFVGIPLRRQTEILGAVSIPEYFGHTFRSQAYRKAAALVIILASVPYLQAVFKGCMIVMGQLTGLGPSGALSIAWLVVVAYTIAGGFHAVARTDAVQGVIMLFAAVSLPTALIRHGGGWGPLFSDAVSNLGISPRQVWTMVPFGTVLGIGLAGGFKMLAEPRQVSRYFAIDFRQMAAGRRVAITALAVSYLFILPVGFLSHGLSGSPVADTDLIVPEMLGRTDVVPPLLGAVFLAAFLAAAMSSIDSVLLVVAAAIQRDLLGWTGDRGGRSELTSTRIWVLVYSVLPASLVSFLPGGIIQLTTLSGAIYGAAFLPPLLFSLHGRGRPSVLAAWSSLLLGTTAIAVWKWWVLVCWPDLRFLHEVVASAAISFAVYWIAACLTRRSDPS